MPYFLGFASKGTGAVPETSCFSLTKTRRKAKKHPRAQRAVGCWPPGSLPRSAARSLLLVADLAR